MRLRYCGYCVSNLQVITALSKYEIVVIDDIALYISKERGGMFEARRVHEFESGYHTLGDEVPITFFVSQLNECHILCEEAPNIEGPLPYVS